MSGRVKRVYVAHPLRSDPAGNVIRVTEICRRILSEEPDVIPLSPIHAFSFLTPGEDADERAAERLCFGLLSLADELRLYGAWEKSAGCRRELDWAVCRQIPVRYPRSCGRPFACGCLFARGVEAEL